MRARLALVPSLLLLALAPAQADELGWPVPQGRWMGHDGDVSLCLVIGAGKQLELDFQGRLDRNPVVAVGTYALVANKMADYSLRWTVEKITQKQLSKCRESWLDVDLPETRQLGAVIRPRQTLPLTLHFGCSADSLEQVQLCLHQETAGKPQGRCATLLRSPRTRCAQPPPIDGAKINAPVSLPKK